MSCVKFYCTTSKCENETSKLSQNSEFYAVVLKEQNKVIGKIYFHDLKHFDKWEIGYTFNFAFQQQGYAFESVGAFIKYAFEKQNVRKIIAEINGRNFASQHLAEKLGMTIEARFHKDCCYYKNEDGSLIWDDLLVYAILKGEKRISAINHFSMYISDLEKSKNFFEKYFGAVSNCGYYNPVTGLHTYFLSFSGNVRIEIMHNSNRHRNIKPNDKYNGYHHIALSVGSREEVNRITSVLVSDGYTCVEQPRTTGDGYYESIVLDDDGNRIEITV